MAENALTLVDYLGDSNKVFTPLYSAHCHCGAVAYDVEADPLDAKICHCSDCQSLHGAPMQWAAIFQKEDVRFRQGADQLMFYHAPSQEQVHKLPSKVACRMCGSWIGDEGRRMWLAFPSLFNFPGSIPPAFRPTCHIFYDQRSIDVHDDLPKWTGHKDKSERLA